MHVLYIQQRYLELQFLLPMCQLFSFGSSIVGECSGGYYLMWQFTPCITDPPLAPARILGDVPWPSCATESFVNSSQIPLAHQSSQPSLNVSMRADLTTVMCRVPAMDLAASNSTWMCSLRTCIGGALTMSCYRNAGPHPSLFQPRIAGCTSLRVLTAEHEPCTKVISTPAGADQAMRPRAERSRC